MEENMRLRLWLGGAGTVSTRSALLDRLLAGVFSCVVLGSVFGSASPAAAREIPLSLNETVRQADAVVLGTITAKQSRWGNTSKRWMVTEYTLAVENVIYTSRKGEPIGTSVTLAYWGGTIGNETQAIADVRLPVVGERLLVFLRPNSAREFGFTPVVGFNQGLFSVVPDVTGGPPLVRDDSGRPLALTASGDVVRRRDGVADAATVSLETFIAWIRANIGLIKAARSQGSIDFDRNDPRVLKTFAKTPALLMSSESPTTNAARRPAETLSAEVTGGAPAYPSTGLISDSGMGGTLDSQILPEYVPSGKVANLPIVVNNFPDSFTPWSPEDEYQMSKWNYYASDVFHVYTTPTGTYGWPNGVFDLDGFPSSANLQSVYGTPWDSNTVAITFLRYSGNTIIEADIAINPAFGFTLDDEWIFNGAGSVQSFRLTMLHELGHMHGLDHNFNFLAVMNYVPSFYRFFGLPYMDDAAGIRAEYPSRVVNRTDLGVYLYYETGFQSVTDATYPSSVAAGGNLTFTNYHVENVGTNTISTPTIEWYLTTARNYDSAYYFLGQRTFSSLAPFTYFTPSTVQTTFTVPTNVPSGTYYLGGYIRDDSGVSQSSFPFSNNFAFSRTRIQVVNSQNFTITVSASPGAGGTVSGGGTFPAGSSRTVTASANSGYAFTNWTENGSVVSSSTSYTFNLNANRNLVANFTTVNYTITASASPSAGGTVGGGGTFPAGSSRTVTATANSGYTFANWTENGGVVSSSASYTFTLNGNRSLVANFTLNPVNYTITVSASPSPGGTVGGSGTFPAGSSRTVTATANTGYTFATWTENGGVVSSSSSYTFTLNGNRILAANFTTIPPPGRTRFDFDGDGKAEISVFRPTNGVWYFTNSSNGAFSSVQFGMNGDKITPADFDGDGKADISVFRPSNGTWYRLNSSNSVFVVNQFGQNGDIPVPGDFDGDGKADLSVFRPSNGTFYRLNSSNGQFVATQFGANGDKPQVGDFDGDGKTDLAVFRPSNGVWYILRSSNGVFSSTGFGQSGDIANPADFDGDNMTDISVFRPSNGTWYRMNSSNGQFVAQQFGANGDTPSAGDYDGDGRADLAVFRPSNGVWYLMRSTAGFTSLQFGANGDSSIPSAFGQ